LTRVSAQPLTDLVEAGWAAALEPVGRQVARMGEFLRAEIDAGRGYLPPGPDVLRAFTFPMAQIKVLIVGQDPYPTPGHAMGLSFSVAPGVRPLPRSLANIVAEYGADLGYPASHRGKGWEEVTECAIRALVARDQPLVAILWGRDAATLTPMLTGCPVIASAHPSPLSANRGFFGSRPFSRANELLAAAGAEPVDWRLT
jgi:uracil-DNA glycosylase